MPTTTYPRVEFHDYEESWRPGWHGALAAVEATIKGWLDRLDDASFDEVVKDANGRCWHVTGKSDDGGVDWRVELAGYSWSLTGHAERPAAG